MKCKVCGHRTSGENALPNMMKHYRKAHPGKMKRKAKESDNPVRPVDFKGKLDRLSALVDEIEAVVRTL